MGEKKVANSDAERATGSGGWRRGGRGRRRGVSEGGIMKLCGWKTRSMLDRYNIIDEVDLAQAVAKRFEGNGKLAANSQASSEPEPSGSSSSTR